jgi:2-amino-4-hydroxy-6-hydroxymethyldihydropteridine diphosphokinase
MAEVYLILGSNLGNRQMFLHKADRLLQEQAGATLERSSIYETKPWGFNSKDFFLNQVVKIETSYSPSELLKIIKEIEIKLGRTKKDKKYDQRCIDIDILFYNDEIFCSNELVIPHPLITKRKFVLMPLNEIAPDYKHPTLKKPIKELVNDCDDKLSVRKFEDNENSNHKLT